MKGFNIEVKFCNRIYLFSSSDIQISNFSTYSNLTLVLLWVVMAVLVYYIKHINTEVISVYLVLLKFDCLIFVGNASVWQPFSKK